jgi:hypothetical protein
MPTRLPTIAYKVTQWEPIQWLNWVCSTVYKGSRLNKEIWASLIWQFNQKYLRMPRYIRSEVVMRLVKKHPEFQISALVRNKTHGNAVKRPFPAIRAIIGDL